jgi:hypothetical protein
MEKKYFLLGTVENSRIIKFIRIVFGMVCIIVAAFWINFNINTIKTDWTLWITILFLCGFGFFQIWSGLGYATRFIEIGQNAIRLKKNSILPVLDIVADDLEKIEIYPLNVIFFLKSKKTILLRLGTTFHEQNELILDEIIEFTKSNSIQFEVIEEKL